MIYRQQNMLKLCCCNLHILHSIWQSCSVILVLHYEMMQPETQNRKL